MCWFLSIAGIVCISYISHIMRRTPRVSEKMEDFYLMLDDDIHNFPVVREIWIHSSIQPQKYM